MFLSSLEYLQPQKWTHSLFRLIKPSWKHDFTQYLPVINGRARLCTARHRYKWLSYLAASLLLGGVRCQLALDSRGNGRQILVRGLLCPRPSSPVLNRCESLVNLNHDASKASNHGTPKFRIDPDQSGSRRQRKGVQVCRCFARVEVCQQACPF